MLFFKKKKTAPASPDGKIDDEKGAFPAEPGAVTGMQSALIKTENATQTAENPVDLSAAERQTAAAPVENPGAFSGVAGTYAQTAGTGAQTFAGSAYRSASAESMNFDSAYRANLGQGWGEEFFDDPTLKREFELYKVQKTLKKLGVFACAPARSAEDVKTEVVKARAYGFKKVAVYPTAVQQAIRAADEEGDPDIVAAISFPHGEDALSVKKCAAKQAFSADADGIIVCLSLSPVKRGDYRTVKKEADAITASFSHRGKVGFFVDLTLLNIGETEKLFRQFQKTENLFVLRISGNVSPKSALSTLKNYAPDAKWAVLSERSDDAFLTESIDAGAERVYTPFSEEVATRLLSRYRFTVNDLKLAREKED